MNSKLTNKIRHYDLYVDREESVSYNQKRFNKLTKVFNEKFYQTPTRYFSSPGRTEISGNHTDHNHGKVIAASINLDSIACVSECESVVEIFSEGYEKPFIVNINELDIIESEVGTTNALIRGIASGFVQKGFNIGGFKACVTSDVLKGSGLSSSASIEVLIGTIFNHLYNEAKISPVDIAKIGQYAENVYFKKPCGLMDQIACAVGGIVSIDFFDAENPVINKIDFDFVKENYSLVFIHTGGSHINLTNDYAAMPVEMKKVANEFGKSFLSQVGFDDFIDRVDRLRKKVGDRSVLRAYHFFKENKRVDDQIIALTKNDFLKFITLVNQSGNSSYKYLQNVYSVEDITNQPASVALAFAEEFINRIGKGVCRIHGGGFEGTVQVLLPSENVKDFNEFILKISKEFSVLNLSIRQFGAVEVVLDN